MDRLFWQLWGVLGLCVFVSYPVNGDFCPKESVLKVKTEGQVKVETCEKQMTPCPLIEGAFSNSKQATCWIPHGKTRYLNPDRSELILSYKDGKLNGRSYAYASNKNILSEENYQNNLKEGEQKSFHENGKKKTLEIFSKGIKVGEHLSWHSNGELEKKVNYSDGRPSGTWSFWYANAEKKSESRYGSVGWEGLYRDWYSSGKLHMSAQYVNGQLEGTYTLYYPNGKKMSERRYSKGLLDGLFEEWDSKGERVAASEYKSGKFVKWSYEPLERSEDGPELKQLESISGCLKLSSKTVSPCLSTDLDGNGYPDFVLRTSEKPDHSLVLLTSRGKLLKEIEIAQPQLEVYSARAIEGQFGEPPTPRDGLVVWGRGNPTRVFLYDFDKEEFENSTYQSDLDL